jgi:hypothetical protein
MEPFEGLFVEEGTDGGGDLEVNHGCTYMGLPCARLRGRAPLRPSGNEKGPEPTACAEDSSPWSKADGPREHQNVFNCQKAGQGFCPSRTI